MVAHFIDSRLVPKFRVPMKNRCFHAEIPYRLPLFSFLQLWIVSECDFSIGSTVSNQLKLLKRCSIRFAIIRSDHPKQLYLAGISLCTLRCINWEEIFCLLKSKPVVIYKHGFACTFHWLCKWVKLHPFGCLLFLFLLARHGRYVSTNV